MIQVCSLHELDDHTAHEVVSKGGDPTGTGRGGKSAFGKGEAFKDEFASQLSHKGARVVVLVTSHAPSHGDRAWRPEHGKLWEEHKQISGEILHACIVGLTDWRCDSSSSPTARVYTLTVSIRCLARS